VEILEAIILGFVQGATEFVPVSSSGHLVLVPWLLGWDSPGLLFDTAVHLGTLVAVLLYFRHDWKLLVTAWLRSLRRRDRQSLESRLAWLLLLGTGPAALLGFVFEDFFESLFGEPGWVSFFLLVTAGLLAVAERVGSRRRELNDVAPKDALLIGLGQAAAIAPGMSRSGATISVGLLRGLRRQDAARFSFLLATPIIIVAGLFKLVDLVRMPDPLVYAPGLAVGFVTAAAVGYVCIWGLLRYLERGSLYVFSAYCVLLGVTCLVVYWLRLV
jgi:undecaprenyl-diphosphatase